jgi:hypothetical protein
MGLDPDSMGSLDQDPDSRIRIKIQEGKNDLQKCKKLINFIFELLDVLFSGLKASPVAWTNCKEA